MCQSLLEMCMLQTCDEKWRYGKSPSLAFFYEGDLPHFHFQKLTALDLLLLYSSTDWWYMSCDLLLLYSSTEWWYMSCDLLLLYSYSDWCYMSCDLLLLYSSTDWWYMSCDLLLLYSSTDWCYKSSDLLLLYSYSDWWYMSCDLLLLYSSAPCMRSQTLMMIPCLGPVWRTVSNSKYNYLTRKPHQHLTHCYSSF